MDVKIWHIYIKCALCLRQWQLSFSFSFHGRLRMNLHQCPILELETTQARFVMLSLGWIFTIKYDENDLLGQLKSNPSPSFRNISLESMTMAEGSCCTWDFTIQNSKINEQVFCTFHHNSAQHFQPNGAKSIFQMFSVTRSSEAVQS